MIAAAGGVVWRPADEDGGSRSPSSTGSSTTTGRCPRASRTPASTRCRRRCARWPRRPGLDVVAGRRSVPHLATRCPTGVPKRVDYWADAVRRAATSCPTTRSTSCAGSPSADAAALCSYEHDREVLADAARTDLPREVALLLVRHGQAGARSDWDGPDELRPLDARGPGAGAAAGRGAAAVRPGRGVQRAAAALPADRGAAGRAPGADRASRSRSSARTSSAPTRRPAGRRRAAPRAARAPGSPSSAARAGRSRPCCMALGVHRDGLPACSRRAAKGSVVGARRPAGQR